MFASPSAVERSGVAAPEEPGARLWPVEEWLSSEPEDDLVPVEDLPAWDRAEFGRWPAELPQEPDEGWDATIDNASAVAVAPWESLAGIAEVPPDGMLALVLEEVDLARVDDVMLVEVVAAWERVAAWAHLGAALAAGELSRRASMSPMWSDPVPANACVAGDELAMRLGWSRPAANRLVRDGRALDNELLLVAEAVRAGAIDTAKLRTLTDRLANRPGELAWAVAEAVLPEAGTRTPSQLAADVDRALLAADPVDTTDRLARAAATRRVCHPKRLPDGMAGVWAVLPAVDAVRIDATLEATARAARVLGDSRTLDQLRADILTDLATGRALLAGTAVAGREDGHEAAADGIEGIAQPVRRSEDQPEHDELDPQHGSRRAPVVRVPRMRIDVTVALSTLMGLDEQPGELAGFGPISAQQARALAAGGVWRRVVTDPLTGAVLDVGRTRYRPPQPIANHVNARDQVCAGPGCPVPAHRCELDHTTEYHGVPANGSPDPGTTSADNLGPLSSRCHRLKTDGGFTLRQPAPGVFEWITPAGLAYRVTPGDHGRVERLDTGTPGRPTTPNPGYPDEPPF